MHIPITSEWDIHCHGGCEFDILFIYWYNCLNIIKYQIISVAKYRFNDSNCSIPYWVDAVYGISYMRLSYLRYTLHKCYYCYPNVINEYTIKVTEKEEIINGIWTLHIMGIRNDFLLAATRSTE